MRDIHPSPFVLSVDGLLHEEADNALKHMATALSYKWFLSLQSCQGDTTVVRTSKMCIRGLCTKWRSGLGLDNGVPLVSFIE